MIYPSLKLMETSNSNIYASDALRRSDFITHISPKLVINSFDMQHGVKFSFGSDHALYNRYTRENYTDIRTSLSPYWQITRSSRIEARLAYDREHDARTAEAASNNIGAEEPVRWGQHGGRLAWQYKPGRAGLETFYQYQLRRHENVASLDNTMRFVNDDRDRTEQQLGAVLGYDVTDQRQVFLSLKTISRDYKRADYLNDTMAYDGPKRDSDAVDLRAGTGIDLTPLFLMTMEAGLYHQQFSDTRLNDVQQAVGRIKATWQVTALTTIDVGAQRDVYETIQPEASAFTQNRMNVQVMHELRRHVLVGVEAATGWHDYAGSTRKDEFWGAGPQIIYKMNKHLAWKTGYLFDTRSSNQIAADYTRHRLFSALEVKF